LRVLLSDGPLYLIDAHSLIYQVFHALPAMSGPKGQPTNAVYGFVGDMLRLRSKNPDYLICVFDPHGPTFRDELFAEYKAQRDPMPDELRAQIPVIMKALEALRIPIVQVAGYEADDALATIARQAAARGIDVFVCTSDKDCRQLLNDKIKMFNLRKEIVLDEAVLLADWGIKPDQVVDLLAMTGDTVDNVPGIPGVGVKTAAKLLQEHGTIEGIYAALPTMKKGKLKESLEAHRDKLAHSRKLVKLVDDMPMTIDWEGWKLQEWDGPAFLAFCEECGFRKFAADVRKLENERQQHSLFDQPAAAPKKEWDGKYLLIDTPAKFVDLLQQLRQQKRFAVDLETTNLNPLQADVVGYAICWQPGTAYYLAVRGPAGSRLLDPDEVLKKLKPLFEAEDVAKINQNIKYDMLVLKRAGVEVKGVAGDSMVADYLLHAGERTHNMDDMSVRYLGHEPIHIEELIGKGKNQKRMDEVDPAQVCEYAAEDADVAYRLCEYLEPQLEEQGQTPLYRDLEIPLIEVLTEMEWQGIKLDVALLKEISVDFAKQIDQLEKEIHQVAGRPFNIDSPKQLRQILFDELKLPSKRETAVSGEKSTGQDVLEELAAEGHELPRKIISYRQLAKLKGTYVDALPEMVNPTTGRLHCSFNQTVAATGRLSASDPNLQNIPMRTEQGRQIRRAFIAEEGWTLLTVDYSQIELRVLAHIAGDSALKQAFAEDKDIHSVVAAQIFKVPEADVTSDQRRVAKTVNFGVFYGLSAFGLAARLGISKDEAGAFIDAYYERYPGVAEFQQKTLDATRQNGYVTTILGRRRRIQGIRERSSHRQRNQPEREALNTVIQGSAADLMKRAMLLVHRRLRRESFPARMLLQIHDELVFEVRPESAAALASLVEAEMTGALTLDVPLKVDLATGPNWLDVEPIAGKA
jgi:DNA polymerase I